MTDPDEPEGPKPKRIVIVPEVVDDAETLQEPSQETLPAVPEEVDGQQRDLLRAALRSLKSPNTRRNYRGHWRRFAEYHGARPGPFVFEFLAKSKIDAVDMIHEFADHMEEEGKSTATIAAHLRAILSMIHRWHMAEIAPWTLRGLVTVPKPSKYTDVTGVSPEAVEAMIAWTSSLGTPDALRDTAILCLLHDSALRRREVASLDMVHWRPERRVVLVWGKGHARGVRTPQPVSKRAARYIDKWLEVRGDGPGALFFQWPIDDPPTPISTESVRWIVSKAARDAGVTEDVSPHRLRHAGITAFARRTKDADAVRRFARHTKFDTTTIYMQAIDDVVIDHIDDDPRFD